MNADLNNEKILLTENLIIEKQEEIHIKEIEHSKLQAKYFGVNGSIFEMQKTTGSAHSR